MSDYELIPSEITEELEAWSFTVKQRLFIKGVLNARRARKQPGEQGTASSVPTSMPMRTL